MSAGDRGDKTEKPTKRRREKAREEGQVAKSREIDTAFSILVLMGFLYIAWDHFLASASGMMTRNLSPSRIAVASVSVTTQTVTHLLGEAVLEWLGMIWPVLLLAVLCGILFNVLQTGFLLTGKALAPKFSRINPIEGFKRIFSTRSLAEMLKAVLKVAFLAWIAYSEYTKVMSKFSAMIDMDVGTAFSTFMKLGLRIGIKLGGVLAVIAMADFFYQRWRYEKDLMMSKQEVKEEYKQLEGDPQIKGMIKRRQRQMSRMRMMHRVQEADVVITNPTHYAVALRYKEGRDKAPLVLAKGADYLAAKIKEKAREHGIEIVENKPVARSLYRSCDIGDEIPRDMYQAVAEILAYVYRMKDKTGGRHG